MNSITIIGTGLAGYNLAKEIRKYDKEVPLTLITADHGESYSKPMLSNALSKGKSADQLIISDAPKMAEQLNATIQTQCFTGSINLDQRIIQTSKGEQPFDKLVLAVGASQRKLPLNQRVAGNVLSVNDLDDYREFQKQVSASDHVLVIGAGLIGCEFANDLVSVNKKVTVVGSSDTPLDRLLLPEIGGLLRDALRAKGVEWRLGVHVTDVIVARPPDKKYSVLLSDGSSVEADVIMSAIGLLPNVDLAKNAGIKTEKGIVVDRFLETSAKDVYALGDCMEIEGLLLPFVLPIMNCARALSKTLTGEKTRISYPAMPVVVKTPAYPVVVSPPAMGVKADWQVEIDSTGAKALCQDANRILYGFILTGDKVGEKQPLTKQLPGVLD